MADNKLQANGVIKQLDDVFAKAPHLPANIREILVSIAPWIALIFGILGLLAGLAAVGISPVALLGGVQSSTFILFVGILTIVSSVLMLLAFPKLQQRAYQGWMFLFWAEVASAVSALLDFNIGSLLGILLGFYILFEIKGYYK